MLNILENESLSKYTTFHIGGAARYFVIVKNTDGLKEALEFAANNNLKYFVIGGGSNLLFSDSGFDGLVIKMAFMEVEIDGNNLIAGAGVPLLLAVKKAVEAGLAGLENFAGIPGTVGGAACGNAGAYGKSMSDAVVKAEIFFPSPSVIPDAPSEAKGQYSGIQIVDKSWFEYKYRSSKLKYWTPSSAIPACPADGGVKAGISSKPIILRVWFGLQKGEKEILENRVKEILAERSQKEPKGFCAGCAFKNIKRGDVGKKSFAEFLEKLSFNPDEKERFKKYGSIPAAWFIEHAELKGKKIGGAYVPSEHGNYIMNDGSATADHILQMFSFIKQQVRDKFGVQLEEEIEAVNY